MGRGRKESGGKAETPHEIFKSGSKPSSADGKVVRVRVEWRHKRV